MRYCFITLIVCCTYLINAQSNDVRDEWRVAKKLKLDLANFMDEYPALLIGYEYTLKDNRTAIEHELGPILGSASFSPSIEKASGFKTSHTYLLYSKNNKYAIGVGAHFRQLNVQGQITTCAAVDNFQFGGCSFFRLYDDPIRIQRWAGYVRLRRLAYTRRRVMLSFGMDIGAFTRSIRNEDFQRDNLTLSDSAFRQDLNDGKGVYFRTHAQLIYRL